MRGFKFNFDNRMSNFNSNKKVTFKVDYEMQRKEEMEN